MQAQEYISAFVTQWKLIALTAEVFKIKKQVIRGLPDNGLNRFPFVVDEPPIDLSVWPEDSSYLVLQSELFTEAAMKAMLIESFRLCQRSGLHWLVGDITKITFSYLKLHREIVLLKNLYDNVMAPFVEL
jgi:hypothetical protein